MFTVCPKCALTLTVTAADLRIAQGFVRCGQCTNVFNALLALSDERQPAAAAEEHSPPYTPDATAEEAPLAEAPLPEESAPQEHATEPEHEQERAPDAVAEESALLEIDADETQGSSDDSIEQTSLEFNPAAVDVAAIFVDPQTIADDEPTGTYESIVLRSQESSPVEEEREAEPNADDELNDQLESLAARIDAARQHEIAQTHSRLEPLDVPFEVHEHATRDAARPLLWSAALAALGIILVAQAVNHYRDELAVNARLHRPLAALYGLFGVTLVPRWDLSAYEVHQLGAQAVQNAGQLTVRASVRNDAQQPQPLPLLRVTLLDRFGNRLASRDVPPRAYLNGAAAASSLLPPGERVDAQMAFVDPGKNAVGFEIDACLAAASLRVHCANDPAAR